MSDTMPVEEIVQTLTVDDKCRVRFLGQGEEHVIQGSVIDVIAVGDGYIVAVSPETESDIVPSDGKVLINTLDSAASVDTAKVEDGKVTGTTSLGVVVSFGRGSGDAVGQDLVSAMDADFLSQFK